MFERKVFNNVLYLKDLKPSYLESDFLDKICSKLDIESYDDEKKTYFSIKHLNILIILNFTKLEENNGNYLEEFIQTIFDKTHSLKFIIISEKKLYFNIKKEIEEIELKPLDESDSEKLLYRMVGVKLYPKNASELIKISEGKPQILKNIADLLIKNINTENVKQKLYGPDEKRDLIKVIFSEIPEGLDDIEKVHEI